MKRRASSLSSVSSITSIELTDDAEDSDDDADDEDDPPAARAPSYGRQKAHKAGLSSKKKNGTPKGKSYRRKAGDGSDSDGSVDDGYAGVDDITDDDDEDQDVEKQEELLILESEDEHDFGPSVSGGNATQWTGPGSFDDQILFSGASFFDEDQLYGAMDSVGETGFIDEADTTTPTQRHVHFEGRSDSSSDSDSDTEDGIPSDFLQQDSLDPQLRRMIEADNKSGNNRRRQSDETFGDSDYGRGNIYHAESDAVSEGSSGYESMANWYLVGFVC